MPGKDQRMIPYGALPLQKGLTPGGNKGPIMDTKIVRMFKKGGCKHYYLSRLFSFDGETGIKGLIKTPVMARINRIIINNNVR